MSHIKVQGKVQSSIEFVQAQAQNRIETRLSAYFS